MIPNCFEERIFQIRKLLKLNNSINEEYAIAFKSQPLQVILFRH